MLCIQLEGCPFDQGAPHRAGEEGTQRNQGHVMGVMKQYTRGEEIILGVR